MPQVKQPTENFVRLSVMYRIRMYATYVCSKLLQNQHHDDVPSEHTANLRTHTSHLAKPTRKALVVRVNSGSNM